MIERTLVLPVSAEEFWRELTEPESMGEWFGATVEWDLTPGGRVYVRDDEDGEPERVGLIDGVTPARELQFRWWPKDDESDSSEVTYTLSPDDEGTRLTVTERPLRPVASASAHAGAVFFSLWDHRLLCMWLGASVRRVGAAQTWC